MRTLKIFLPLLILTACGDSGLFGFGGSSSGGNGSISAAINEARSFTSNGCSSAQVGPFHFRGQAYNSMSIYVSSTQTEPASGSVDAYYIGTNSFGDLLVISKMNTGEFDVALMLCYLNNYTNPYLSINANTTLTSFLGSFSLSNLTNERRGSAISIGQSVVGINNSYYQYQDARYFYSPSNLPGYYY
jgi:hypothetical protein